MRTDWPSVRGKTLYKALLKLGFVHVKTRGSHHYLVWPEKPELGPVQVPVHGQIEYGKEFVKAKWKEVETLMGVSAEEFLKAIRKSK